MLKRKQIIQKVSKRADVRIDVTRDVINAFIDVAIEEIVNNKYFCLTNVLTVSQSGTKKGYTTSDGRRIRDHTILRVRITPSLRSLHRLKERFPEVDITMDNWRKYAYRGGGAHPDIVRELEQSSVTSPPEPNDSFVNPFIDEE